MPRMGKFELLAETGSDGDFEWQTLDAEGAPIDLPALLPPAPADVPVLQVVVAMAVTVCHWTRTAVPTA